MWLGKGTLSDPEPPFGYPESRRSLRLWIREKTGNEERGMQASIHALDLKETVPTHANPESLQLTLPANRFANCSRSKVSTTKSMNALVLAGKSERLG